MMKTVVGERVCKAARKIWKKAVKHGCASWYSHGPGHEQSTKVFNDLSQLVKGHNGLTGQIQSMNSEKRLYPQSELTTGCYVLIIPDEVRTVSLHQDEE